MENLGQNTDPVSLDQAATIAQANAQAHINETADNLLSSQQPQQPQQPMTQLQQPQQTQQPMTQPQQPQQPVMAPNAPDAYKGIIEQQNAQIAALMAQNQQLNAQVVQMVQNGAQITQQPTQAQPQMPQTQPYPTQVQQMAALGAQPDPLTMFDPPALSNDADFSLEGLAGEIGNHDERK